MRIGLDARYAFREQRRGIGEYVAALIRHLPAVSDERDEFLLFVDRPADLRAVKTIDTRFVVKTLAASNPLLWEEISLPRAARRSAVDLLHLTSNYGPTLAPCPTIYTVHDTIEFLRASFGPSDLSWRHALGRNIRVHTLPRQARRAKVIITVSETSKRDIEHWLGVSRERIRVIPLAVSEEFRPAPDSNTVRTVLSDAGIDPDTPYVLALGALDPRKNGETLIRAFAHVHKARPDVALRIVGIERLKEYPIPLNPTPTWLHLHGFVPRHVLVALLQGACVFAYPSLYEGFGLPPIQAMACGVPVVVSDHAALAESIGTAAVRFPASDSEALADVLLRLLADEGECARLAKAGLDRAAQFTWRATVTRTYQAYRAAFGRSHGPAA